MAIQGVKTSNHTDSLGCVSRVAKNEAFKPAEIQFLEHIIMTMNRVKNGGND
jgi:hypothetical protein